MPRSILEDIRDVARGIRKLVGRPHHAAATQKRLKCCWPISNAFSSSDRLRLRGPIRARDELPSPSNRPKPPKAGQADTDAKPLTQPETISGSQSSVLPMTSLIHLELFTDFFNKIGHIATVWQRSKIA